MLFWPGEVERRADGSVATLQLGRHPYVEQVVDTRCRLWRCAFGDDVTAGSFKHTTEEQWAATLVRCVARAARPDNEGESAGFGDADDAFVDG